MLKDFVVLLVGVLISLACGELLVRLVVPDEQFWIVSDDIYAPHPGLLAYTLQPSINAVAHNTTVITNSFGFRGSEWSIAPDAGVCRLAFIGDSHTFGFGVEIHQTFAEQLIDRLHRRYPGKKFEALNFGANGYNSVQELQVVKDYVLDLSPDLAIITVSSNDHEPALRVTSNGKLKGENPNDLQDDEEGRGSIVRDSLAYLTVESKLMLFVAMSYKRMTHESRSGKAKNQELLPVSSKKWLTQFPPAQPSARLMETVFQPLNEMLSLFEDRSTPVILASFNALRDYNELVNLLSSQYRSPHVDLLNLLQDANSWQEVQQKYGLGWDSHLKPSAHRLWADGLAASMSGDECN